MTLIERINALATRIGTEVKAKLNVSAKASAAEINTGTEDGKYVTPKGIKDSDVVFSAEVTTVKKLTAAEYAALGVKDNATMYVIVG
jgi:hypothetical protein